MRSPAETLQRIANRRKWTEIETLRFLKSLAQHPAMHGLFRDHELPPPVEGGSADFVQVSGPNGRVQTFNAGASINTFLWNPQSLRGQLAGGDFLYVKRIKFRNVVVMTNNTEGANSPPSWEAVAQAFGNVRVYSPFLGELVPKSLNSVPLLANHDQYFVNGFRPITRRRPQTSSTSAGGSIQFEFVFEIPFERDYLLRSQDSCPWLPFFEGGTFEVDFNPSTSLNGYGWTVVSCQQTCTIDYYADKQALIHSPIQSRLYKVTSPGPEYTLKGVGSPNGLDGVISGSRLAALSLLSKGYNTQAGNTTSTNCGDNGYYAAFGGGGGPTFGGNGLIRVEVPFRDQVGIDDVNAMLESFLSDCNPIRMFPNEPNTYVAFGDVSQFPFVDSPSLVQALAATLVGGGQSLVCDLLDFWALIWPQPADKISDFQKVNGDLNVNLNWTTPPGNILNLFRTDEVCGFTPDKVKDLMGRMGMPHVDNGGTYDFVPKYAGAKKADATTIWGFPLKIIRAKGK